MHVIPEQAELLRVSAYFLDYAAWRMGRSTEVRYKRMTLCKAQHSEELGHKVTAGACVCMRNGVRIIKFNCSVDDVSGLSLATVQFVLWLPIRSSPIEPIELSWDA